VQSVRNLTQVFATPQTSPTLGVRLLAAAAGTPTSVQVSSSNPEIVTVLGDVTIAAGSLLANIPLVVGQAGTAVLSLTIGGITQTMTVTVGTPPAGVASPVIAQPSGVTVVPFVSIGSVGSTTTGQHTFGVRLFNAPVSTDVPVAITSSNSAVASVTGGISVAAGQQIATLTISSTAEGVATLTISAAGQVRQLTVLIGAAAASQLPGVVAPGAGVTVSPLPPTGAVLIMPVSGQSTIGVPLLPSDAGANTPVTVTSSNEAVARALVVGDIAAGGRISTMTIQSGQDGIAMLTVTVNGQSRTLPVLVGSASAGKIPAVIAPIAAIEIKQE
jgi:hypothetical protein